MIWLISFLVLVVISISFLVYSKYDYKSYIINQSNKKTIEEIDKILADYEKFFEEHDKDNLRDLEDAYDEYDVWKQVKNYKIYGKVKL